MRKLMCVVVVGGISFLPQVVKAQSGTVGAGETIPVRMSESVSASQADGRIFRGTVDRDVSDNDGRLAIPAGSAVELTARQASSDTLVLDLESVMVNGQRYGIAGSSEASGSDQGLGQNKRTAKYVGGGAILGTILGAALGGGKGAAVGAVAGGAAGAGTQVATKGHSLSVPSGAVVSFRLDRAMSVGVADSGYTRNGAHYHRVN